MKKKRGILNNKLGQETFGLSFGVIFSIILIVFFIIIAIIVIKSFLGTQKCAEIGIFKDNFQKEVDKAWNSQKSEFLFEGILPSNIEYVCFANLSAPITATGVEEDIGNELGVYEGTDANLFLYPRENTCEMVSHNIKHLDLAKITSKKNPYCIAIDDGKIDINIERGFQSKYVGVS